MLNMLMGKSCFIRNMKKIIVLYAVAPLASTSFPIAYAEPSITEQTLYYDVIGASIRDVNGEMFSGSPIVIKGKKYLAACYPDIKWRFTYDSDSDWCKIKSISVTARITYQMPRWTSYSKASSDLQAKWNSFYERLVEHEKGHGNLAQDTARAIERDIGNLKRRSCQELKEAANAAGSDLLKLLTTANEDYDNRTKHGVLQDAVLHEF